MNKTSRARVALVGLGPIGIEVGKALLDRPYLELLGAADPATQIAGKPLSQILGTGPSTAVDASAKGLYSRSKAGRHKQDVAVPCPGSRLPSAMPPTQAAVPAGLPRP